MKKILNAFSHINFSEEKKSKNDWRKPFLLDDILKSNPLKVSTYEKLVQKVAQVSYSNREYVLFFRGQSGDYMEDGMSTVFPSIYRKNKGREILHLVDRFKILKEKEESLVDTLSKRRPALAGIIQARKYQEVRWALLQHYEICKTPLLDITQSLHVACSFAFDRNENDTGIIYVLGFPFCNDAISYSTTAELLNVRLLSICPPQAMRPAFQEGYLAGPFPIYRLDSPSRREQFDFGRRLIAKFEIPISSKFWGSGFSRIPNKMLYQENDIIKTLCEPLKDKNNA